MDIALKNRFLSQWQKYFPGAELPFVFFYSDRASSPESDPIAGNHCLICELAHARAGRERHFEGKSIDCRGGRRYLGFSQDLHPKFEHFLSHGIPGELKGERYKKSPELVRGMLDSQPFFQAPARWIVFKRWDILLAEDEPLVVIFFANADVISGLYTLANYDELNTNVVFSPMGSGCSSIVYYPYHEAQSEYPRAVLGMFDATARVCIPADALSFSVPFKKFERMVNNMDESFLSLPDWEQVSKRIQRRSKKYDTAT